MIKGSKYLLNLISLLLNKKINTDFIYAVRDLTERRNRIC